MINRKKGSNYIAGDIIQGVLPVTDKYWFQFPHLLHLNLVLLVPLLSSSTAGYDGSLMNGLQTLPQWKEYFGHPTGALLGLVNAAQSIGSVLILPPVGWLSDHFGRKKVLLSGIITITIATAIGAGSVRLGMLVFSRVLVGAGGMLIVQPAPLLIAEQAYPTHRGKYTSAFWTMYYLGAILASWATFGTQNYTSTWSWRIPTLLQACWPCVQLCGYFWLPESPRWLIAKDRGNEARAILAKYHAGGDEQSPLVDVEMMEIVESINIERAASSTGWGALVSTPGNRARLFIAVFLGSAAQWNEIGVVWYYLILVLDAVGITDTFDQTLINGLQIFNFWAALSAAVNLQSIRSFIPTFILFVQPTAAFFVDRLGRRTLFMWSNTGMLVSYIVWTACSAVNSETGSKAAGIVVIVCLFTFYFHYDIAYTPLLMSYPTEIFTYSLRSKGLTCELLSIYCSLIIAAFVNPVGLDNIGWKYYTVFCYFLVVIGAVTFFTFPETKGYSLEEIAVLFGGLGAAPTLSFLGDQKAVTREVEELENKS